MVDRTKDLSPGDRFRFGKVTVQARKMSVPQVIQMSNNHRGKKVVCSKSGFVFVDKEWSIKGDKNE